MKTLPVIDWKRDGDHRFGRVVGLAGHEYYAVVGPAKAAHAGWLAFLYVDGQKAHESEHVSAEGAEQAAWRALQEAIALREDAEPTPTLRAMADRWLTERRLRVPDEDLVKLLREARALGPEPAEGAEGIPGSLPAEELARAKEASEKWYVKARVYGAIAARYQQALERIAQGVGVAASHVEAREALKWRHSEKGGVPRAAVDEVDALLKGEASK